MRVAVFCGSSDGTRPEYRGAAESIGRLLGRRGMGLVFGGGRVGLMGVLADAALDAGGEVLGVIPEFMTGREVAHDGVTELAVVGSMHERKALMFARADAFCALPGGLGTLDELIEVTTWAQLGLHHKPIGLLDVAGCFGGLLAFLDRAAADGFVRPEHRDRLLVDDDPGRLLDRLADGTRA